MSKNDATLMDEAFDILADELGEQIGAVRQAVTHATQAGDYDAAQQALNRAKALDGLLEELADLRKRALGLIETGAAAAYPRLPKGLKTPGDAYRRPILQALVDLGGSAPMAAVLDRVFEMMRDRLNEHDLASLATSDTPRWRNTAQWCRNTMREEGLIVAGSPHGVWEISAAGRKTLASGL
ncbi:MAG: winged helix-turn-helix domain-containing protein [Anaerolineae bacterium]|nr:winged helix-turn-helix domain-containing protein [Anaerolineae bacterium]